ncbi:MAG: hypothetical protein AAF587_36570 [Bacteroidota bacterium]
MKKPRVGFLAFPLPFPRMLVMLSVLLLHVQCTEAPKQENTAPGLASIATVAPPAFALFYIDASESTNRSDIRSWINWRTKRQIQAEREFLVYFSDTSQPVVSQTEEKLGLIRSAISQKFPSIPKPLEEADRLLSYLDPDSLPWKEGEVDLNLFMSPSLHDLAKDVFLERLLAAFGDHVENTNVLIYTETEVPPSKQFTNSRLRSISYQQLSHDLSL